MLTNNHRISKRNSATKTTVSESDNSEEYLTPAYSARGLSEPVSKYSMSETPLEADVAAQIIKDELNLDGNPALNLASFVTTWMDKEAEELMLLTLNKNFVDAEEYPQTVEIHDRCVNIFASLFNAPHEKNYTGCATVGSSEAIHLAGLALKWNWKKKRDKENLPSSNPNIVMGQNVQVCWEKFARYFEVEPRYVPLSNDRFVIGVDEALKKVDENTIGVVGILGSTYTGEYEPIEELALALDELALKGKLDIPMHIDAASGGFVAPFLQPEFKWDFRLERVVSINTSGHKYGLVYPGIGWVVWRDADCLPEELIFHVNYLGGDHPTFQLNFSRGASQVIAQYYNFLRLGKSGYRSIMTSLQKTAVWIADQISGLSEFEVVHSGKDLPVVCFKVKGDQSFTVFEISDMLKQRGWIVPAYTMAPDAEDIAVLRIVVKEGLSLDLAHILINDIKFVLEHLKTTTQKDTTDVKSIKEHSPVKTNRTGHRGVC